MKQKRIFLIISFFLVASFVFGYFIFNKKQLLNNKDKSGYENILNKKDNISKQKKSIVKPDIKCENNWEKYENDVIGLTFCYPKEWGNPKIEPNENLTLLEGALEEYSQSEDNEYKNSLFILFEKGGVRIRIFDNEYKGEHYPNASAYKKGYIDNIPELKANGNICDYKINFTELWEQQGRMTEFWSECDNLIKTRIVSHEEYFDKNLYSYKLESLAYFKLKNNFFDNALITDTYANIVQVDKKINEFNNFFEAKNYPSQVDNSDIVSREEYLLAKDKFKKFINSFYVYNPINEKKEDFKTVDGEDSKITVLRKYYWLLENKKLEEAYNMHNRINTPLDDFKTLYKKTRTAKARDFTRINDNVYKFFVDYQDHNKAKTVYRITAKITAEGKIEIINTEEIVSDMVRKENYLAYAKKQNNKSYVILEQYGVETVIDEGDADYEKNNSTIGSVKFFKDIKFSETGNYLIYTMTGWEWSVTYVYDIQNSKNVLEFSSGFNGFEKNEKSFFVCNSSGMATFPEGSIYSIPEFKKKFELFNPKNSNVVDVDCSYDKEKNELTFTYTNGCEEDYNRCKKNEVIYSFDQEKMISSRVLAN